MNNDLVSNLKRAMLATLSIQGSAGFSAPPNDLAIRACAELIVEKLCREDSDAAGCFLLVITRQGLEAVK